MSSPGGVRPAWSAVFDPAPRLPDGGLPVDADWAFQGSDGAGVAVAIVDSGVEFTHPDVVGPTRPGAALHWAADDNQVACVEGPHDDLFGHGTACAAIVRRLAPAAELTSVRVLGGRLSGRGEVLVAGVRWAIASGARVVNLSLSSSSAAMRPTLQDLADDAAHAGVVLICAMNNTAGPCYPSQFSSVISVAACAAGVGGPLLANPSPPADFGAPGLDLEVAWTGGGQLRASGNSFAAPYVSGLVARLLAKHPNLTGYQVKAVLRSVAGNVGAEPADVEPAATTVPR